MQGSFVLEVTASVTRRIIYELTPRLALVLLQVVSPSTRLPTEHARMSFRPNPLDARRLLRKTFYSGTVTPTRRAQLSSVCPLGSLLVGHFFRRFIRRFSDSWQADTRGGKTLDCSIICTSRTDHDLRSVRRNIQEKLSKLLVQKHEGCGRGVRIPAGPARDAVKQ